MEGQVLRFRPGGKTTSFRGSGQCLVGQNASYCTKALFSAPGLTEPCIGIFGAWGRIFLGARPGIGAAAGRGEGHDMGQAKLRLSGPVDRQVKKAIC